MAAAFVDDLIKLKKVVVFSKTTCGFCSRVKNVLSKYVGKEMPKDQYEVVEINNRGDCDELQNYLQKITGARTVPRVFIDKKCVGGCSETEDLDRSGKLKKLLGA